MSRPPAQRLADILAAGDAIDAHLDRGPADDPLADGLVFDAVRQDLPELRAAVERLTTRT